MRLVELITTLVAQRRTGAQGGNKSTLLAVCPNSKAVMEAAVKAAAMNNTLMLFAATLNQVDRDGGYTGWTPDRFSAALKACAGSFQCRGPLYACLDHGGPWLKDRHTLDRLSFEDTYSEVKLSISACLAAGYELLHIDPTVDRRLPGGTPPPVEIVVERTVDLIAHAEAERQRMDLPSVVYEVGTEEVHGGLVDFERFRWFLSSMKDQLTHRGLAHAWPGFIVAQVGTNLHTTTFDQGIASKLCDLVITYGSLVKGHYTDWVENAQDYPRVGMGGANVGPEFTAAEYLALKELEMKEHALILPESPFNQSQVMRPSNFSALIKQAVASSGRWQKWLQADEKDKPFDQLGYPRQEWLVQTGARYVWTEPAILAARDQLYENLRPVINDPHGYVIDKIVEPIDRYINRFNLFNLNSRLG